MPKIVVQGYEADGEEKGKATHKEANKTKLQEWFATSSNWEKLSEQLTKKLGSDKFKNVTLSSPTVTYETISTGRDVRIPKVTFTVAAKDGYNLTVPTGNTKQISLSIRVLYTSENSTQNALRYQGASSSAATSNSSVDDANVKAKVNVYLNYTGPEIMLNAELPQVGNKNNTSINGTSNVDGDFNTKFKKLLVNVVSRGHAESSLFQAVINYVNKFDPKFRAQFVTNSINGVTITKVQNTKELRPGTLDDLVKNDRNNVFLQQMKNDTEAVYLPVTALTNDKWLNTVLVRIPLTKFVRPLTEFQAQSPAAPTQEGQTTQGQENSAGSGALGSTTGTQTPSGESSQASDS
ncbi:hemagglutinin [Mycoplasmopsis synoviae]|uniref:hemagglutinin n=1 Tax=Mycoplasmopsis synoviae TaxID=2109 RepID=UPI001CE09CC0|nr:hemagglutinin [Mycoplasmopsis synoviae]UBX98856.1 hemagglutinin [Mycoplasmopsis synoviae]